ncbi:alpha/beta hydrolase [Rhizobium sp. PAMB 3174]
MSQTAEMLRSRIAALVGWQSDLAANGRTTETVPMADGGSRETVTLSTDGRDVSGILLLPARLPCPAILYCHAHGGNYEQGADELLTGAPYLTGPYAEDLLKLGFAVLSVDMPGFGSRQGEGSESAMAKAALWRGDCLFGEMLKCQAAALGYLASRPEVDGGRIAALGISMGGALASWLGALDGRVAAVADLCMLADIKELIALGVHDRHGIYLTVPGLLAVADMGDIAGQVAPRPQFVGHERGDHLTPAAAQDSALATVAAAYRKAGVEDKLDRFLGDGDGHRESPAMRQATLAFLRRWADGPAAEL